jgi:ferrous iron transport protein B
VGTAATDWVNDNLFGDGFTLFGVDYPAIPTAVEGWLEGIGASPVVVSLVSEGIVGGVGSVLGFIPQMFVLFVLLCFLEDCGYMSRVAFVMDRVFRRFGLSGKSFIPMLVSSGCGVPGILSTNTIENEKDRRMTAMLTTMIPCGAKQPIIALVMGVLIGGTDAWWIAPLFYFLGVISIIVSAVMLKKTKPFAGEPAPFLMELPEYHLPSLKSWWLHIWERVSAYIKKAGTIIFAAAVGIWVLSRFGWATWEGGSGAFGFLSEMPGAGDDYLDYSLLAGLGNALGWIFAPLGCNYWQATAASISALIAKENLVSTFGSLYGLADAGEGDPAMWAGFAQMFTQGGVLHVGAMCAFVAFNMLDAPCFAAMGTLRRQMDDPKWFWFAIGYQCGFAWVVGLIINQLWELFALGNFGFWTVVAFAALGFMVFQLLRPMPDYGEHEEKILSDLSEEAA